jgi:hypothetical protein
VVLTVTHEPEFAIVAIRRDGRMELITEQLLPEERGDWHQAAVRACAARLAPLRYGPDYVILPVLSVPLCLRALLRAQFFEVRMPQFSITRGAVCYTDGIT